jgi:hypothetical protein
MLPPLLLDWLGADYATREELLIGEYDLPCYPFSGCVGVPPTAKRRGQKGGFYGGGEWEKGDWG